MLKKLPAYCLLFFGVGCTSLKQIGTSSRQVSNEPIPEKKEVRFLENISTNPNSESSSAVSAKPVSHTGAQSVNTKPVAEVATTTIPENENNSSSVIHGKSSNSVQAKYSALMNTDASDLKNLSLYKNIDNWYGAPYRYGGNSKSGIDCSGFVQAIFISAFGVTLPRTASEQYKYVKLISTTQLKEGDLLFFNTTGGVSHVGIYLQNNKFVHASVANGVTITDMYESYYVRHLIGAGRLENNTAKFHPENVYPKPSGMSKKKHSKKSVTKKKK